MGRPVSVVIAEMVMQKLEAMIMLKVGSLVEFWYRHDNDIITCVREDQVGETGANGLHSSLGIFNSKSIRPIIIL